MYRACVTRAISFACFETSSYVRSENGPISPGRWQGEQFLKMIGAMSWIKVGARLQLVSNHKDTKTQRRPLCVFVSLWLEIKPSAERDRPVSCGCGDSAEGRRIDIGIGIPPYRPVQEVDRVSAKREHFIF